MRITALLLATCTFVVVSSNSRAQQQNWSPDLTTVQRLEADIQPSAYPRWGYASNVPELSQYTRYYDGFTRKGHKLVEGEFVLHEFSGQKVAGIHIVGSPKSFPMISDGACGVIHVLYDADAAKMLSLTCNGRA